MHGKQIHLILADVIFLNDAHHLLQYLSLVHIDKLEDFHAFYLPQSGSIGQFQVDQKEGQL